MLNVETWPLLSLIKNKQIKYTIILKTTQLIAPLRGNIYTRYCTDLKYPSWGIGWQQERTGSAASVATAGRWKRASRHQSAVFTIKTFHWGCMNPYSVFFPTSHFAIEIIRKNMNNESRFVWQCDVITSHYHSVHTNALNWSYTEYTGTTLYTSWHAWLYDMTVLQNSVEYCQSNLSPSVNYVFLYIQPNIHQMYSFI